LKFNLRLQSPSESYCSRCKSSFRRWRPERRHQIRQRIGEADVRFQFFGVDFEDRQGRRLLTSVARRIQASRQRPQLQPLLLVDFMAAREAR